MALTGLLQNYAVLNLIDKRLFEKNRAIQLDAVKSIQNFGSKYEQRYKLVDTMLQRMFKVLLIFYKINEKLSTDY